MKRFSETKALVTGASGFLGSHLVERLSRDGYRVYALLRKSSSKEYLKDIKGINFIYGDLFDIPSLKSATKDMDVVIHCAALMSNYDWVKRKEFYRINCMGTKNMLDAAISSGIEHFIHISTVGVLGGNNGQVYLDENALYGKRLSNYEWSKSEAERILLNHGKGSEVPITIVRPAQLYGPRMVYGWLVTLSSIKQNKFMIIGDGSPLIHMTYIDDVIDGIVSLILKKESYGKIFHFAGPEAISLKRLFFTIAENLNAPMPQSVPYFLTYMLSAMVENIPYFVKPKKLSLLTRHRVRFFKENHIYDISKAKEELGYNPRVSIEAGVKKMVDWFVENNYLAK